MDDVSSMEKLCVDSHVSTIARSGVYQGMTQSESAVEAYAFMLSSLVLVEGELEACLRVDPLDHLSAVVLASDIPIINQQQQQQQLSTSASSSSLGSLIFSVETAPHSVALFQSDTGYAASGSASGAFRSKVHAPAPSPSSSAQPSTATGSALRSSSPVGGLPHTSISFAPFIGRPNPTSSSSSATSTNSTSSKIISSGPLELPIAAKKRLNSASKRALIAAGLDAETEKLAGLYLAQQDAYSRSIGLARLASRMSNLSSERSVLEYAAVFDRDEVAGAFDEIMFVISGASIPTTRYRPQTMPDLALLEKFVAPVRRAQKVRRRQLLGHNSSSTASPSSSSSSPTSSSSGKTRPMSPPPLWFAALASDEDDVGGCDGFGRGRGDSRLDRNSVGNKAQRKSSSSISPPPQGQGGTARGSSGGGRLGLDSDDDSDAGGADEDGDVSGRRSSGSAKGLRGSAKNGSRNNLLLDENSDVAGGFAVAVSKGRSKSESGWGGVARGTGGEWRNRRGYLGFSQVGPDLFHRDSNPQLLLNEASVLCFMRAHSNVKNRKLEKN